MQECYRKTKGNYRKLRGIEGYSAVGTVIAGFALLMQEGAHSGADFALTELVVMVKNIRAGVASGIFMESY